MRISAYSISPIAVSCKTLVSRRLSTPRPAFATSYLPSAETLRTELFWQLRA
jgi:hypothetical protein